MNINEEVINKRIKQYEIAQKAAIEAIELYDTFKFLYGCLIEQLRVFDEKGDLRDRADAEENINSTLSY